jgi:AcrR family transcriptional regulator
MTTHQLAERAGVSVGSLYQYFPSKDALFRWVIQRHLEKQVKRLRERDPGVPRRARAARDSLHEGGVVRGFTVTSRPDG